MSCPICGTVNDAGAQFCSQCGATLSSVVSPSASGSGTGNPGANTGLQKNVAGLFCYTLGWLTGLIFLIVEKDPFVRFHAMQSLLTFGCLTVLEIILSSLLSIGLWRVWALYSIVNNVLMVVIFGLWVLLMFKAYHGERYKLPIVGDLAERYTGR